MFIPPEVLCEIFAFFDRQFIETVLKLVCRQYSDVISRYFANTPPYLVLERVTFGYERDVWFDFDESKGRELSGKQADLQLSIHQFYSNWLPNFPRYMRVRWADLLAKSAAAQAPREKVVKILSALQCLWDGFEYVYMQIYDFHKGDLFHKYLEFATAPSLDIGEWKNEMPCSLFTWPVVKECASLKVRYSQELDVDEAIEWLFGVPRRRRLKRRTYVFGFTGPAQAARNRELYRRRKLCVYVPRFDPQPAELSRMAVFVKKFQSALEQKLKQGPSEYVMSRDNDEDVLVDLWENKNSDELFRICYKDTNCSFVQYQSCSFMRYAPSADFRR